MRRGAVVATASVAVAAAGCGASHGPGRPYGSRDVERAFQKHHVVAGRFGDLTHGLSKAELAEGRAVAISLGGSVQVAVFTTAREAAERIAFEKKIEPAPVIPSLRKANVVVHLEDPAELPRVRAALADLG